MIIDEIDLLIEAGKGGAGKVSFGPGRKSGPDGGNGGKGGDVYIKVTTDLGALSRFVSNKKIKAFDGEPGMAKNMYGKDGKDITIQIPIGSTLEDLNTGEKIELLDKDEVLLICMGGLGGRGNFEFRSSTNTTPQYAQPGLKGETRHLRVNLKFMAEYGLIGLPNTGKSSLLNALTNAKAVIGNYPFTTLEPNLGVLDGHIIADIPGLIEGASNGRGLGIRFLKHIDRVKVLIHCISADTNDPIQDYESIKTELRAYDEKLADRKQILVITKSDLRTDKEIQVIKEKLDELGHPTLFTSIEGNVGIATLSDLLRSHVNIK